ncbi:MAG: PAS domain-containing protein [Vicinamibacteria bacterium]|nr:PAS domain-containing protein [Vicinamibacteria bacterium]
MSRTLLITTVAAGVALCLGSRSVAAETRIKFGHLTADDGLSRNWVQCVLKDTRGFLWIGTQNGLNRYDGRKFTIYRHSPGDPHSLPSSVIGGLYEDRRGRLWIGSGWGRGGLALYDRDMDRFIRVPYGPDSGGLSGSWVHAILEDRQGRLWVGTEFGLDRVDIDKGVFRHYPLIPPHRDDDTVSVVFTLIEDRQGRIWAGTGSGLFLFDPRSGQYEGWPGRADHPNGPDRADVWDLIENDDGTLWVATIGGGLFKIDPVSGRQTRHVPSVGDPTSLSHLRVRQLAKDTQGRLWVGTENGGLNMLDPRTGRFTRYLPDPENEDSLNSASIWALYADDQDIVWVGTYNGGLNYFRPFPEGIELIKARRGELSNPHVTSIMEDRHGDIWIGTDGGGLNRIDRKTGRYAHFMHDPADSGTIGADAIFDLHEDADGSIWVGGWDAGLGRLDPTSGRVTRFRHDPKDASTIISNDVWKIVELRTGELLVATPDGVDLFDRGARVFTRLSALYPDAGGVSTFTAAEDARGGLWLGRRIEGVQYIDRASGEVVEYRHDPDDLHSIGAGWVMAVYIDSRENVWFGTEGGLSCLEAGSRRLRRYSVADGLPHDSVTSIVEDLSGNLWLGTQQGLSQLIDAVHLPDRPRFYNFDAHDGLQGREFTQDAAFRSASGRLYFGGERGLNVIHPENIRRNPDPPRVVLTDLKLFNRSVTPGAPGSPLDKAVTETREITLSHKDSVVTLEFAALNYLKPQKNQYAYKLDGFDADWNRIGARPTATYTSLPAGQYVFRVRASNNDGVWSDEGVALQIRVKPRWHERLSVRILLAALAMLVIAGGFRWRMGRLRTRERELARRVEEHTRDLQRLAEELEERVETRTAELAAEKERLAVTLRSIGDGVIATDVSGRVVLMNRVAEELTGWWMAEAAGQPLSAVFPTLDLNSRKPQLDPVASVLASGYIQSLPAQSLLLRRDGSEVLIADSVAPIRDRESRVVGVVLVFRDVTEKRKVEEQLQMAQKLEALGILAGGIAHDFNNLLTGIFGYMALAQRHCDDPRKTSEDLSKALSVLDKARGLTGQLLTFSRAGEPVAVPLSLGPLLHNCARFDMSGSNVDCAMEISEDLWTCRGDEQQIGQAVDNLLLNARQAMPDGGTIRLKAENVVVPDDVRAPVSDGRYVRVTIHDEGPGIPPELSARIFEPFFTTKTEGTGLGLATTYSIVRKHGGHIEMESTPGTGATFTIYLPVSAEPATANRAPAHELRPGKGKILVLDDEEYVHDVARAALGEIGYTVETVSTGDKAVEIYREAVASSAPFDAVILDLTLPGGMGGVAVLARLREIDPAVRAIASSGYSGDPVMANPSAHGFIARLIKPYTIAELSDIVARVL